MGRTASLVVGSVVARFARRSGFAPTGYDPGMTVLLYPLSADQKRLVEVIYEPVRQGRNWPIFQYVEAILDRDDLDATSLLATLPSIGTLHQRYGLTWYDRHGSPSPETTINLTVAGIAHCQDNNEHLRLFLHTLSFLVERYRSFVPSPTASLEVAVPSSELAHSLRDAGCVVIDGVTIPMLDELLQHEPSTWGLSRRQFADGSAGWVVHPYIRKFRGITTVEA